MSVTLLAPEYHTVNVKARMIACAVVREGPQVTSTERRARVAHFGLRQRRSRQV